MKTYIGTKIVKLQPMNRAEYNIYRGWKLPADENGADEGYLVEYTDGGKPNDSRHAGYISWSPKEQADNAYRPVKGMSFGMALEAIKLGKKVARAGWNGKGMFLVYVGPFQWNLSNHYDDYEHQSFIAMKTAQDMIVPWLASQSDMLADDWLIVD